MVSFSISGFGIPTQAADLATEYPYVVYNSVDNYYCISKTAFQRLRTGSDFNMIDFYNGSTSHYTNSGTGYYIRNPDPLNTFYIYQSDAGLIIDRPDLVLISGIYYSFVGWDNHVGLGYEWSSNQSDWGSSYNANLVMPDIQSVEDQIQALTQTTTLGQSAAQIQQNIQSVTNGVINGDISVSTGLELLDAQSTLLTSLSESIDSNSSIGDQIALTNALIAENTATEVITSLQVTQNINNVSDSVKEFGLSKSNAINGYYSSFRQGNRVATSTIDDTQKQINLVVKYIAEHPELSVNDVQYLHTIINFGNSVINATNTYGDVTKSVSDAFVESENNEIDFVNDIIPTETISDIKYNIDSNDKTGFSNIMSYVWANPALTSILSLCGVLMVISLVLGRKYGV